MGRWIESWYNSLRERSSVSLCFGLREECSQRKSIMLLVGSMDPWGGVYV